MSKIGKLPIVIKDGVTVTLAGKNVSVAGTTGSQTYDVPSGIEVAIEDGKVLVSQVKKGDVATRASYGLVRATLANMIIGVSTGFEKKLELSGVGYRATVQGADLVLSLGFSHPVKIKPLSGVTFKVAENVITVSGGDKAVVGDIAARIRAIRPPEPYKGKGIKYEGEYIRRKAGKAAKAVGGK
jgi:large subunit ribosomal protein L6